MSSRTEETAVEYRSSAALSHCFSVIESPLIDFNGYASTFLHWHCGMKSTEYLWLKTKRLVKDERRSKSRLRVCA